MALFKKLLCVAAAVLMTACAAPKKQAFNAAAAGHIKDVTIARNVNQTEYPVIIIAHPGQSFGLIGGLVAAADMQAKTTKLSNAIDVNETKVQERFAEILKAKLEQTGYQSQATVLAKDTKVDDAFKQVNAKNKKSDAILVVMVNASFLAAGPQSDYFPYVVAKVIHYDNKSQAVLYEDTITYGYSNGNKDTVHLASAPEFRFSNSDALNADVAKTRKALYDGLDAVASQIASDLKK